MKRRAALPSFAVFAVSIAAFAPAMPGKAAARQTAAPQAAVGSPAPSADERPVAVRPNASGDVLNINHEDGRKLHNRFLAAGLLAYASVIVGVILILGQRRWGGAILIAAGLTLSVLLYLGVFG